MSTHDDLERELKKSEALLGASKVILGPKSAEELAAEAKAARERAKAEEERNENEYSSEERKRQMLIAQGLMAPDLQSQPNTILAKVMGIEGNIVAAKVQWNGKIVSVDKCRCFRQHIEIDANGAEQPVCERIEPEIGQIGELMLDGSSGLPIPVYCLMMQEG